MSLFDNRERFYKIIKKKQKEQNLKKQNYTTKFKEEDPDDLVMMEMNGSADPRWREKTERGGNKRNGFCKVN